LCQSVALLRGKEGEKKERERDSEAAQGAKRHDRTTDGIIG
jgi:hypothetical protein